MTQTQASSRKMFFFSLALGLANVFIFVALTSGKAFGQGKRPAVTYRMVWDNRPSVLTDMLNNEAAKGFRVKAAVENAAEGTFYVIMEK